MSAHVDLLPGADPEAVRRAVHRLLHQEYAVAHTTIQSESRPPCCRSTDRRYNAAAQCPRKT